ncbi:MAG TPA: ATP-binding protein [Longimicrobiales bacterium]
MSHAVADPFSSVAVFGDLADGFEEVLGSLRRPFESAVDAHAVRLLEWIEAVHRASVTRLAWVEADAAEVGAGDDDRWRAFAATVEDARRAYAEEVVEALDAGDAMAAGGRGDDIVAPLLVAVDAMGDGFPGSVRVRQVEARFRRQPMDSPRIRVLKAGKRLLRPLRKRWLRTVPVADVVAYQACVFEAESAGAFADLARLRIRAATAIYRIFRATSDALEAARTTALDAAPAERGDALASMLKARQDELEESTHVLREEIRGDADRIRATLATATRSARASLEATLETIGTIERRSRTVSPARRARFRDRIRERALDIAEGWERYDAGLLDSLRAEAETTAVAAAARAAAIRAAAVVRDSIDARLRTPIQSLRDALSGAQDRAAELFASGREPTEVLPELDGMIQKAFSAGRELLDERASAWKEVWAPITALREEVARLPSTVAESRDLRLFSLERLPDAPGDVAAREAPLRRFVAGSCQARVGRDIVALLQTAGAELDAARAELQRLRQAVAFNVAAALRGAGREADRPTPAAELVSGVLQRAVGRLDGLLEATVTLEESVAFGVARLVDDAMAEMAATVRACNAADIRQIVLAEETKARLDSSLATGRRATVRALAAIREAAGSGGTRVRVAWDRAAARLGMAPIEKSTILSSLDAAELDERITANLPLVYRQLFALAPLEWDDFLVGREAELERIRHAFERWKEGHPTSLALYGEKGSGKTTLLNAAWRTVLAGFPVTPLDLRGTPRTADALVARLAALLGAVGARSFADLAAHVHRDERRIVIIEDAHGLFLRTVGGFALLRELLALIAATNRQIFWVVTMEEHAWRYLHRVLAIQDHFTFEIDTTNLPPDLLQTAILQRHHVSGFAIRFEPDERLRGSRRYRRLTGERARQEETQRVFFEQLARIAEGNVFLALYHWLRSIAAVEEHTLVFRAPRLIDTSFLERLPLDTLHTIAAAIQHGGLTVDDHAAVFQRPPLDSRLLLSALADGHLLVPDADGRYTVNKVLYRPFVRLLKAKNVF